VHLRRALILFAVVLGLTALVAAIAPRGGDDNSSSTSTPQPPPTTTPESATAGPTRIALTAKRKGSPETKRVKAGTHAIVRVQVDQPGQVSIPALGLTDDAEPRTPAAFDVFFANPGRATVELLPAAGEQRRVGTIEIQR
jgi:hypothetical protein